MSRNQPESTARIVVIVSHIDAKKTGKLCSIKLFNAMIIRREDAKFWKSRLSDTPVPFSRTTGQLFGVDGTNELVAWIAELAERQKIMVPSLVAPRLWRQAAEWAYRRDREGFEQFQSFLPLPYRTFEKQTVTGDEAHYLDYLADERKERRKWRNCSKI